MARKLYQSVLGLLVIMIVIIDKINERIRIKNIKK